MIEYHELNTSEYIQNFILLSKKKYKCVLVSNKEQSYKFYNILKVMEYYTNQLNDKFDSTNIIACVTSNAHRIFTDDSYSYSIRKGSLSSFNLYNCNSNNFLSTYDVIPRISCLDNTSLGDVWSSGQKLKEFDE